MVHRLRGGGGGTRSRKEAWLLAVGLQVPSPGKGRAQVRGQLNTACLPPVFLTLLSLSFPLLLNLDLFFLSSLRAYHLKGPRTQKL